MHHVMTAIPVCVLLAMKLVMTYAETCNQGQCSNPCIDNQAPSGHCAENPRIAITIIVTNTYQAPTFNITLRVDSDRGQPLIEFLKTAVLLDNKFRFSATYFAYLGFFIDTIHNVTGNPADSTYWRIISETNCNRPLRCGVSSYIPAKEEVIWFNFTTWGDDLTEMDT